MTSLKESFIEVCKANNMNTDDFRFHKEDDMETISWIEDKTGTDFIIIVAFIKHVHLGNIVEIVAHKGITVLDHDKSRLLEVLTAVNKANIEYTSMTFTYQNDGIGVKLVQEPSGNDEEDALSILTLAYAGVSCLQHIKIGS